MEEQLQDEIKCLDKGFVRLVEKMGTDSSVVQAARVSYGVGTKSVRKDRALIRYLMAHEHTSPFEMIELKFHCKMPIFVARQWIRHRTASVNEISGRYSIMKDEFYIPQKEDVSYQSKDNKQGRADEVVDPKIVDEFLDTLGKGNQTIYADYQRFIESGIARELSRINLPLSLYTEWYWKINLHNLFRFLRLRMDYHAQKEIRVFAEAMATIVKANYPICYEAFYDFQFKGEHFSRIELDLIKSLIDSKSLSKDTVPDFAKEMGKLEYQEFLKKLDVE